MPTIAATWNFETPFFRGDDSLNSSRKPVPGSLMDSSGEERGAAMPEAVMLGEVTLGALMPGAVMLGVVTLGALMSGAAMLGAAMLGQVMLWAVMFGRVIPGAAIFGRVTRR